jgi:hypothetical protein
MILKFILVNEFDDDMQFLITAILFLNKKQLLNRDNSKKHAEILQVSVF